MAGKTESTEKSTKANTNSEIFFYPDDESRETPGDSLRLMLGAFKHSSQAFLAVNKDTSFKAVNQALFNTLGYSRQELRLLNERKDLKAIISAIIAEYENSRPGKKKNKLKIAGKNGEDLMLKYVVKRSSDGRYYYIFVDDISEQEQAEIKLRKSEERYRLIADNAFDLITLIDSRTHCYRYLSPSHQRMLGYSPEELIGKNCFEHMHPYDRIRVSKKLEEGLNAGYGRAQYRSAKKDGSYIWLEAIGRIIWNQHGEEEILLVTRDISDRKKAEEALKSSEERYRYIVDSAADGITVVDCDSYRPKYINPTLEKMLGYSSKEYRYVNLFDRVHPEDRERIFKAVKEGEKTGENSGEFRYRKKDGNYIWLDNNGKVIYRDGQAEWLCISRDISDRKQAEEDLRYSEERYRIIADSSFLMISIFCPDSMQYIYWNSTVYKMLGLTAEDILGRDLFYWIHPEDHARACSAFQEVLENGEGSCECRHQRKDGSYIWIEAQGKLIRNPAGKLEVLFFSRDVSELREARDKLQCQLEEQQELINNLNELFYIYGPDFRLRFVNRKTIESLGYSREEMIGKSIFDFVPAEDLELVKARVLEREHWGEVKTYEHRVLCRDGRELLVRVKGSSIIKDGSVKGVQILAEDITEQRRIEKEMLRLAQLQTVGEMAAGIGHEVRNPMTTIKGFLQLMSQDTELSKYQAYFDTMLEELDRANSIISEFLSLAKNKMVNLHNLNLNDIITQLYPLLLADAMISDKYILLELGEIPNLLLDDKEMRQLIINLVRNGLEAMETGQTLEISTRLEADEVILSIKDQGKGIEKSHWEKLGTPFFTTKDDGTGLGLAICYSIARRHNASIRVDSSSLGTTFEVCFEVDMLEGILKFQF
ncbi:MAG: PAS domain S-box protein [Syntrophomonas sp.]|uniref:PAS domain-containing sensor histidine kinase n=1 Tax=Syntrophomonas sp. TaxID=2053627 RepID=UPI00261DDD5F|nr:PAS domain-containing sensor histidine kinase [Syntrophomonas sp.]MDD2510327.1 PAS domain S-box protein [Syntrophomonas sp.]MDD3879238.1 PAS domain S-box protein [Syntrophomonas sp.]MDD4626001.1 PAS domain S-box protein [Syntrophomonas sp.]